MATTVQQEGGHERAEPTEYRVHGVAAIVTVTLLAGVLLAWSGQASAPEEETGQLYHHNWWNYYARGTYRLKQNQADEAQADFQRCLGVIPGRQVRQHARHVARPQSVVPPNLFFRK